MSRRRPWAAIVEALEAEGVEYVFGLPGNPELLYNDLYESSVRPVLVRMETSAVFMAMAYARVSGRVGVVHASPGPGMANLVPGLLEAQYACAPLVCVVSAAGPRARGKRRVPGRAVARDWSVRSRSGPCGSIFRSGRRGRCNAHSPWRRTASRAPSSSRSRSTSLQPRRRSRATGVRWSACAARATARRSSGRSRLLADSERPVIWAGGGVGLSGAEEALVALAETLDAPVVTTPSGRGSISETHRLAFGSVGLYRTRSSARPVDESDCVLYVGTRLEEFQTGLGRYLPATARVIQVDVDPFEIERNIAADVAVVGDAKLVLEQLADATPPVRERPWTAELAAFRAEYERAVESECSPRSTGPLRTKQVVHALNRAFADGFVLVHENGGQDLWSYYCPFVKVTVHRGCVAPAEQTVMGLGVAGAIGAKLARPDADVVCVTGDGAFQMYMKEIPTALQHSAPVLWVVLDNAGLHWVKWIARATGERYLAVDFDVQPDLAAVAAASGAHAERIGSPEELDDALERARDSLRDGRPAVLVCAIDTWDYPEGFVEFHRDVWGLELPDEGSAT